MIKKGMLELVKKRLENLQIRAEALNGQAPMAEDTEQEGVPSSETERLNQEQLAAIMARKQKRTIQ
jgi:hypothetical protein